jgi:2',3'-cyclic-nucleotide 2'-phosphodiesterase (5'-nucleotidase family)
MASLFAAFAGLVLSLSPASLPPVDTTLIVLRILTTNDLHGALLPRTQSWSNGREVGGAAAIAGMMTRLAAECGCPTLRLDAGDAMQGTPISNLTYGRATVEAFNAMGYAAAAVGNHELDWTVDTLAARIGEARFAWLTADVRTVATGARPAWTVPWRMVRAGPLKVALIGYTTSTVPTVTRPDYVAGLRFDGGAAIVDSLVAVARGDSAADVVILLAHEGGFCGPEGQGCRGEVFDLANALTRKPDLIVSGHSHSLVNTVVNGIPIVQARSNGTALGIVDFVAQPGGARAARIRVETVWADREQPDTVVARVVDVFQRAVEPLASRPVATLAEALTRGGEQHALGNLIADAYRAAARADAAIVNNGGIRADLPAGAVSWGDLFQVLPFQNYVTRLTVTGAVLRQAIAHAVGAADSRAHVSGVRVAISRGAPDSLRSVTVTLANGASLRDGARYTLAVPDFLASGGSGYSMLRGQPAVNTGIVDIDAFVTFMRRARQPVRVTAESRIATAVAP